MSPRLVFGSALACAAVVALAAVLFELSFERAALLAPVIVACVGAAAAVVVLWTRIAVESLRRRRHPGRVVAIGLAAIGLIAVISLFVSLPRE
jgi:hypothetical protein